MRVTVIGAANIDITTKSKAKITQDKSNAADIVLTAGGVARNISAILARHGEEVDLITAVGRDPLGSLLQKSCKELKINTDAWIIKTNAPTAVNLMTINSDGEPHYTFDAMTAPESIRTAEITKHKNNIKDADLLILDLNLSEKIITTILEFREDRPVLVDGVSVEKIMRIENILDKIDMLRINRLEAERLTGITLDTKERVKQACYSIVDRGVNRVFVTLGMAGVCAANKKHNAIFVPAIPMAVKDSSGAGDAFSAGIALNYNRDLRTQAESGVSLAAEHIARNT